MVKYILVDGIEIICLYKAVSMALDLNGCLDVHLIDIQDMFTTDNSETIKNKDMES